MEFYFNNLVSKLLLLFAFIIVASTLWYTNTLANQFKIEEKKKVALWAKATKELSDINNLDYDVGFVFEVVNNNTTVPAIQINEFGEIIAHRNVKQNNKGSLENELDLMKRKYPPIEIDLINGSTEYIYYKDSKLLQQLKYFPLIIFLIIGAFMLIAYFAFSNARIAQQNKVWTGMAKETAHQIGTPLSSLVGWMEHLKNKKGVLSVAEEMEKDINRLTIIASRFSKIGSLPKLEKVNLVRVLEGSINYIKQRASSEVSINLKTSRKILKADINIELFEWVIENMLKNSIDAIVQKGSILVNLQKLNNEIIIDIIDNGKGIKKTMFREIFEPGYTSKKRGWGLGLSLVKRIIQDYHKGKVKVLRSIPDKETVIRISLNK